MEPLKNIELPNSEGGLSNVSFESSNLSNLNNYENQNPNKDIDILKSRENMFSTVEQSSVGNQDNAIPSVQQTFPPVNGLNDSSAAQPISVPAIAADTDLMENEWVKELKQMIMETKNDPFAREVRFKEMQIDYLKKRYNRIINGGK